MPAAIPIALAVGSAVTSAYGSNKAAKAQESAARTAADTSQKQYEQTRSDQLAQYQQQREDQAPYRQAGYGALSQLSAGIGEGGQFARNFSAADFNADPGYQFRQQEGEQSINRAAGARGGLYSGATLKALSRFNSGLASQEYGNAYQRFNNDNTTKFNRLASIAGVGQTATNATGQAGQNAYGVIGQAGMNNAGQVGNALQNAGEARASGYVGAANAFGSAAKQYYDYNQQQKYLSQLAKPNSAYNGSINGVMGEYGD